MFLGRAASPWTTRRFIQGAPGQHFGRIPPPSPSMGRRSWLGAVGIGLVKIALVPFRVLLWLLKAVLGRLLIAAVVLVLIGFYVYRNAAEYF